MTELPELPETMIRVVKVKGTSQIANISPEQFRDPDIGKISTITNQIIVNLQNNLMTGSEQKTPDHLTLSEVELTFGIDFGVDASAEAKIPIIGPSVGGGVHGGATFEVHIKLTRGNA